MTNQSLSELKNIGPTVAARLHAIGVTNETELRKLGSARAYKFLSARNPNKHLPLCYYLYSLEGAIQNRHWDEFSDEEKAGLRLAAGLSK